MPLEFSDLSEDDIAIMDQQRTIVREAARAVGHGDWPADTGHQARVLQSMIDNKVFPQDHTFQLQALGVAFGDILCEEGPFRWVIITDEYGCDPTLRWRMTSVHVNALTMISKRIERNEHANIEDMLNWAHDRGAQLGGAPV